MSDDPLQAALCHLQTLFPETLDSNEYLELRCLDCSRTPARVAVREYHGDVRSLALAAMQHRARLDVFFGVGTRRCPAGGDIAACACSVRGADHVARLPAAWVDLDVARADEPEKPWASIADLLARLAALPLPPNLVVGSGSGLHAYWTLAPPTSDISRVVGVNRSLARQLRGDHAGDAARILRVAGTYNRKHGKPLPVELLRLAS